MGAKMEHRYGTRFASNGYVLLEDVEGVTARAILNDISVSGARLQCPLRVPIGARVYVRFPTSKGARFSRRIVGQMVRETEDGFAIEWFDFAADALRPFLSLEQRTEMPAQQAKMADRPAR
jgi:hypothetical protein